jgi:mannose/cellobiose epimerase-like protein (N-acyl-D-glucosamine 2-epimerase family)
MSSPNSAAPTSSQDALRAACALIGAAQSSEGLQDADIQSLLGGAVRLYAQRASEREEPLPAFGADAGVTATDAMLATTAILKAVNVATFELGMWQAWTRG